MAFGFIFGDYYGQFIFIIIGWVLGIACPCVEKAKALRSPFHWVHDHYYVQFSLDVIFLKWLL